MADRPSSRPSRAVRVRGDLAVLLFVTLAVSYAYFWQSRDWNTASRLMLTYALVDRHTVQIDGLEWQVGSEKFDPGTGRYRMVEGDLAVVGGHYYTEKAPGQSLLGAPVYAAAKWLGRIPDHPLYARAMAYWPADYWCTLGTSGLLTAGLGVLLYAFCLRLGISHLCGVLVGLAYGLGTPAFLYGTLYYGHQTTAFCTLASFFLLYRAANEGRAYFWHLLLSGLLAGFAVVVEYPAIGVSALLAVYAVAALRRWGPVTVFMLGAICAGSLLLVYNYRAFGDPFELGYAHLITPEFRAIHAAGHRLGVRLPDWPQARQVLLAIMWGRYRGLLFYAPVLAAAPLGWLILLTGRRWSVACVSVLAALWLVAVNVCYPAWEGGWCTGPRLLVPAIPFAMLGVAGLLRLGRFGLTAALVSGAAVAGAAIMVSCVAVGGRFPPAVADPFRQVVLPRWLGQPDAVRIDQAGGRQFEWNLGRWALEHVVPADWRPAEPSPWRAVELAPLVLFWLLAVWWLVVLARRGRAAPAGKSG